MAKCKADYWMSEEGLALLDRFLRHADHPTDQDIADFMEISRSTLNVWKEKYPEISDILKKTKDVRISKVEKSLEKSVEGHYAWEEKWANKWNPQAKKFELILVEKKKVWVKPDPTLVIFYLKNRDRHNWRDKQEIQMDVEEDAKAVAVIPKREIVSEPDESDMETTTEAG